MPALRLLAVGKSWRRAQPGLVVAWVVVLLVLFRPRLHGYDPVGYYSWLRSVVIQGNLNVDDEFARFGLVERGLSPTGYRLNEWGIGSALLWAPFFLLGHVVAVAASVLGCPVAADGYTWPYLVATGLGSAFYVLLALHWLYELCCEVAPQRLALLAVLASWLASPLLFYMSAHPFMSHANDMAITTLFFAFWWHRIAGRQAPPANNEAVPGAWLLLGLVGGVAACVRLQSVVLLCWPVAHDLLLLRTERGLVGTGRGAAHLWGQRCARWAAMALGSLIGFSPQLVVWRVVFGRWLVLNPYGAVGMGSLDWTSPHWLEVLFSTDRGLFLWTPMAALGLVGLLGPLRRARPAWSFFFLAHLVAQVYLVGSWELYSGAAAFGQRFFTNFAPAWGVGLAALYGASRKVAGQRAGPDARRWPALRRISSAATALPALVTIVLVAWNGVLLARYGLQDVPRIGPVPLARLVGGQFTFLATLARHASRLFLGLLGRLR